MVPEYDEGQSGVVPEYDKGQSGVVPEYDEGQSGVVPEYDEGHGTAALRQSVASCFLFLKLACFTTPRLLTTTLAPSFLLFFT